MAAPGARGDGARAEVAGARGDGARAEVAEARGDGAPIGGGGAPAGARADGQGGRWRAKDQSLYSSRALSHTMRRFSASGTPMKDSSITLRLYGQSWRWWG